ncbi:MAG: sensor histidine kinase [Chloroflexi bacterium]|nr:sensor histidine kinase [Chloroflexota bacterium]
MASATTAPFSTTETVRSLRGWVVLVVALLTALTVVTAFADDMPESHRTVVPFAAALMAGAWAIELSGVRWPRLVLVLAMTLPNAALALMHHSNANFLFLLLVVAWVGVVGTRTEGVAALVLGLGTVLTAAVADSLDRRMLWSEWSSWAAGLLILWLMARLLVRQEQLVAENACLNERARQAAVLEERQRLSRELHDSVTQALYGISLYAEAGTRALADGVAERAAQNLREIGETTQEALGEMRLLLFELRPPLLEERGLLGALGSRLGAVEARAGLTTDIRGDDAVRLPPEIEQELYRLAQEALNNVLKHAHARHVSVRLDVTPGRAMLEVADDGVGFDPSMLGGHGQGGHGFGVPGMRERAARLGGTLQIASAPGAGTRVRVEAPR